jgi:hypothetical protein
MRVWQLLAGLALFIAVSTAFSVPREEHTGDLEVAASGHSSSYGEDGGSDHGSDHHSSVSLINL